MKADHVAALIPLVEKVRRVKRKSPIPFDVYGQLAAIGLDYWRERQDELPRKAAITNAFIAYWRLEK